MARHKASIGFFAFFTLLFLSAAPSPAQEKTKDVAIGTTYRFSPKNIKGTIDVSLHFPKDYDKSSDEYPVLYLLDAEDDFVFGSAVADFLAANDRIPALAVVSVFLGNVSAAPPQLIAFFESELFPFIEKSVRVQPCRILYGHSARSFAALYALLNRPDLFYGYICAGLGLTSPPWTTAIDMVKMAEAKLSEAKSLPKSFFFSLGDEQPFYPGVNTLIDILKANRPDGLDWKYEHMENDDHFSNKLKTLYGGLEHVFKGWILPTDVAEKGPEAVKTHYDRLSERLGYSIGIPKRPIYRAIMNWLVYRNRVDLGLGMIAGLKGRGGFDSGVGEGDLEFAGRSCISGSKLDDADKIYRFLCRMDPESPLGFNGLGEVCEKRGELTLAVSNFEKAVKLAESKNHPLLKRFRDNLERARAAMKKPHPSNLKLPIHDTYSASSIFSGRTGPPWT
jgi:pimeloyl-ACP methyl ester carboxylesterase